MEMQLSIKNLRKNVLKLNQEVFAERIGVNAKTVGYWESGKNLPSKSNILTICHEFDLPENYFDKKVRNVSFTETTSSDSITLDYYPQVFGSCGSGAFILSEQKELIQVPRQLFNHFSPIKQYSVINAIGESMQPYICSKDKLIVEHWQGEQIKDNQVYVFCYRNEIFVKRLVKNIDEIVVKSDNPDPAYRTRFIEKDEMNNVQIIGEIVGLMRDLRI